MAFSRSEEIYKRSNIVFARGRDSKSQEDVFYAYYPAEIVHVQETCVFVKWFTPNEHEKWYDDDDDDDDDDVIEQISKQQVIAFTPDNIKLIKENEMKSQPPDTLKTWEDCVAVARQAIKEQEADKAIKKFTVNQ